MNGLWVYVVVGLLGQPEVQRRLTEEVREAEHARRVGRMDPLAVGILYSGSSLPDAEGHASPTATGWLEALPRSAATTLPDQVLALACKSRLRIPVCMSNTPWGDIAASTWIGQLVSWMAWTWRGSCATPCLSSVTCQIPCGAALGNWWLRSVATWPRRTLPSWLGARWVRPRPATRGT